MVFVLGLSVGSFINMAVYRTAIKHKLRKAAFARWSKDHLRATASQSRSFCDGCGKQLRWYENVPVLSWIIQGGKSRCCANPLPREYPVVEISTGVLFLLNYELRITSTGFRMVQNYELIINLLITSLLIFSLVFDLKYMILPDMANYLLIGLALVMLVGRENYWVYLLSGVGSGSFFFILNRIRIRGLEAMGMGDVKYAIFSGLFLGFPQVVVAGYLAFVTGALVSVLLLTKKIVKKTDPIPFGPFLILGTGVAFGWGEKILNYVLRIMN